LLVILKFLAEIIPKVPTKKNTNAKIKNILLPRRGSCDLLSNLLGWLLIYKI